MTAVSPWWAPHVYADRREFLKTRRAITRAIRDFFENKGFVEVETPCLQASPGLEIHLWAFETALETPGGDQIPLYLHTSPELACKKLLAAGEEKIFTLARVFRNRETGPLHHPEFTMLEWYRGGEDYDAAMEDCEALLALSGRIAGASCVQWRGGYADLTARPRKISVVQAFADYAGVDLEAAVGDPFAPADPSLLASEARRLGLRVEANDTWSDLFSKIMSEKIEPHLGCGQADFLVDYPASEAALARLKPGDGRFAERFELYLCGVELANGYSELTDVEEQKRRAESAMAERLARYAQAYPIDDDFLAAVAQMPRAGGVALGLDRLVMLACGAASIEQVLWAPVAFAERSA